MAGENDIFKEYIKDIGTRIKKIRLARGLSLEKLGLEIGLSRMQVHRIESGYNVTIKTLLKLAIALEVSPEKLLKSKQKFKKEDLERLVNNSKASGTKKS